MSQQVLNDIRQRQGIQESLVNDMYAFGQHQNPLDQTLLHQLNTELTTMTGASRSQRARITVLSTEDYNRAVREIVPRRLIEKGLAHHFRVLADPRDPHHIFVGPSALSGLNDRHPNVITDLIYHLIAATGRPSSLAFERGAADILAADLAARFDLDIFTDQYPNERRLLETVAEAMKADSETVVEVVGAMKHNPSAFFQKLKASSFYRWWDHAVRSTDGYSPYIDIVTSLASQTAQMEGSFMEWARACAQVYVNYREQQRERGRAGAAKRAQQQQQGRPQNSEQTHAQTPAWNGSRAGGRSLV